jgi:hypothetical protein
MKVTNGDRVKLTGTDLEATVEEFYEDGSIDARIYKRGHESDGAVTHVLAGNFTVGTAEFNAAPASSSQTGKTERIDEYHTITR